MSRDIDEGKKCPDFTGVKLDGALQLRHGEIAERTKSEPERSCVDTHMKTWWHGTALAPLR